MHRSKVSSLVSLSFSSGLALLVAGCGPLDGSRPASPAPSEGAAPGGTQEPSDPRSPAPDPMIISPDEEYAEFLGSGMCSPAVRVYDETLPDTDTSPADLALTAIEGFALPAGVGATETRTVFTSEAAFVAAFGSKPAGVDFSKEWVVFYSPGSTVPPGSSVRIVRVRERTGSVRVTTVLKKPGSTCSDPAPGQPFALLRVPSPGWTSCRVSFYHRDDSVACPPPWEPGPSCTGTLTAAGIDTMMRTRPRSSFFWRTRFFGTSYASHSVSLGAYRIEHWQRSCMPTGCEPWKAYPLEHLLDYHSVGQLHFSYYTDRTGSYPELLGVSREHNFTASSGSMSYSCSRWAEGFSAIEWDGTSAQITRHLFSMIDRGDCNRSSRPAGATDMPIKDNYGAVDSMTGVVTDRCALARRRTSVAGSRVGERIESLTTIYASW
jgi:hypothetical protein